MNSLTSFKSLITTSWQGATLCHDLHWLDRMRVTACASFRVRSASSVQPNILLMTFMSPNRLVTTRWFGLPFLPC